MSHCLLQMKRCFTKEVLLLRHMEVPRLGVELELRLPAYNTAPATWVSVTCTAVHGKAGSLTH